MNAWINKEESPEQIEQRRVERAEQLKNFGKCGECVYSGTDGGGPSPVMACSHGSSPDMGYIISWVTDEDGNRKKTPKAWKCPLLKEASQYE
jgi:hypothetical protein